MEQRFGTNRSDIEVLREFCEREGEVVTYRKGGACGARGRPAAVVRLRAVVAEHLLFQARRSYLDFHRTTARERYELLMRRCPGIVQHLPLAAILPS